MVDPRRWGSVIGLVGAAAFIGPNSPVLGPVGSTAARAAGLIGVMAVLFAHYVRPVALGPRARPRPSSLAVYCGCVLAEVALVGVGSRVLDASGHLGLRPGLIVVAVGLHFLPFSWAFHERLFLYLGVAVTATGAAGLVAGAAGVAHAPRTAAVVAGLTMLALSALYARGRFVRPRRSGPGRALGPTLR